MAIGFAFTSPILLALLANLVSKDIYGSAMGIHGTIEDIGRIISPLLYGLVWTLYGTTSIFYICAFLQVLGVIFLVTIRK
jgi:sugar phosphate permease